MLLDVSKSQAMPTYLMSQFKLPNNYFTYKPCLTSLPSTTPVNQLNNIVTSQNNQINDLSLTFK